MRNIGPGEQPAFAPNWKLAVVQDGSVVAGGNVVGEGESPAWAPDGKRVAYVRDDAIYVNQVRRRRAPAGLGAADADARAAAGLRPAGAERPDDRGGGCRWEVGFTSLVDNVGLGAAVVEGTRPTGAARIVATQHVLLGNGRMRTYVDVGHLRYTDSRPHHHWHLMRLDSFDLRDAAGRVLIRDRKQGFCVADHYGIAPGDYPNRRPHFLGNCEQYHPNATHVLQGTSLGYTDRYPRSSTARTSTSAPSRAGSTSSSTG